MKVKQVPVSEFKAHCSEELREVEENENLVIEVTRHGKVIATVQAPEKNSEIPSILGAGIGTATIAPGVDLAEPTFDYEEWRKQEESAEPSES